MNLHCSYMHGNPERQVNLNKIYVALKHEIKSSKEYMLITNYDINLFTKMHQYDQILLQILTELLLLRVYKACKL